MPSVEALNALPYGENVASTGVKSTDELVALDYSTAPFAVGLTAADYRAQHDAHGEPFRYWDAYLLPDAVAGSNRDATQFIEVTPQGKGLFYNSDRAMMVEEFGVVPAGTSMFSVLPGVVEFRKDSRVLRVAQSWRAPATIRRGIDDTDPLPERFVTAIQRVIVNGVAVSLSNVEAVSADSLDDDDLGGIKWLSNAPAAGTEYTVGFKYHPLFILRTDALQGEPIGADGERLPQRVMLRKDRE